MNAPTPQSARFWSDYAAHREAEGRRLGRDDLLRLPDLRSGPLARQWRVRAASFAALRSRVVRPLSARLGRPLAIGDLGAGNCWLSWRLARDGHDCFAIDVRTDTVDGLGAGDPYRAETAFARIAASFDALPLRDDSLDLVLFNASLHYALDLNAALAEAERVARPGGAIAIVDSPFYADAADGTAMVAEKRAQADERFGARAASLVALPFIEYLTPLGLAAASAPLGIAWRRVRVLYPLWYELRPLRARLAGQRRPSRFDIWVGKVR